MQSRIYISLQGPTFDVQGFHTQVGQKVSGQVRRRKHTGAPLANTPLEYWASSPKVVSADEVGAALSDVLAKVAPVVKTLPDRTTLQVLAHVVLEFNPGEEPVGLNFPRKVIELLRDVGAELDVDAVPRVG